MKHYRKLLSLLLIICISMTMLTGYIPVNAVTPATETPSENITPFELPDIVDAAEAEEKGYIGRIKTEEKDLYTFVFANGDGTNTMRVYGHPVKYVAKDGTIRDISLDVQAKDDGGFVTADHEIITTFEKALTDGISMVYDDVEVTLIPKLGLGKVPAATLDSNNKVVTYKMNDVTSFVYELTYAGFKEDIVVKEYTGQTEYEFTLYTNGLTLCKGNESYYLADSDGNRKATIGDIIVFTADERNNTMGRMTYETVRANQEYVLTIHLDAEYLADEKTAYPIRIDPTIEINYDNNGAGAIEDITINSLQGSDGSSRSLFVGRRETYGLSRVLMKFPNLSLNGISANQITSATVELRDLICQGDEDITVECCIYNTSAPAWVEDETTSWQSVGSSYVGSLLDSHVISYGEGNVVGEQHRYSFDILTAAKAWANGTEDPNKGLVFKANDSFESQTGDDIKTWYKTFASYNRSDCWPSLCITHVSKVTLNSANTSIFEGGTRTLVATTTPAGQNVSWTSSNNAVATVSQSGVVTANKAGIATVTASTADGGTASCNIYVYIDDGVYYIQNYFTHYYLHVANNPSTSTPNVYQFSKYTETANLAYRLKQMWKIKYLGEGRYSIRPMYKLPMALEVTGNNADVYRIGTKDTLTGVPVYAQWTIEWCSTGYVFKKDGSNGCALQVENASTILGANVIVGTYSESFTRNRWILEEVTSPPTGVMLYDTSTGYRATNSTEYVAPGEIRSLDNFCLEAVFFSGTSINQEFHWESSNDMVAKINSSNGLITGQTPGTATITGRKRYGGIDYCASYTIIVTEIPNGSYFLENKQTGYYADIEGPTMSPGTIIHQWSFHGGTSQKWFFSHLEDGYYAIKSSNSSSAYYMGVINDSSELDIDVVLRTGSINDGMKWKIEKTANGAYKIIPKTGESRGYILATTTSDSENGHKLVQGAYVDNNSYRDEWYLLKTIKQYSQVSLEYAQAISFNTIVQRHYKSNYNAYGSTYTSITKNTFINEMTGVPYFGGMLHGGAVEDKLRISSSEILTLADITALPNTCFSSVKLIILTSCYSGRSNGFVDTLISKGVDVVIGFKGDIEQTTSAFWTQCFIFALTQGNTVQNSIYYANAELQREYEDTLYEQCIPLIIDGIETGTSDLNSIPFP